LPEHPQALLASGLKKEAFLPTASAVSVKSTPVYPSEPSFTPTSLSYPAFPPLKVARVSAFLSGSGSGGVFAGSNANANTVDEFVFTFVGLEDAGI
jgi:hypothetical protein